MGHKMSDNLLNRKATVITYKFHVGNNVIFTTVFGFSCNAYVGLCKALSSKLGRTSRDARFKKMLFFHWPQVEEIVE